MLMDFDTKEFDLSQLVIASEQRQERTAGLHVSSIIQHMKERLKRKQNSFGEYDLGQFATVGRLWEWALEDAVFTGPRYSRPTSILHNGIWVTPDCLDLDQWSPAEFKCSWISSRHQIDSERLQHYIWQIKAQCAALDSREARCIVLHLCGDWRSSPVPLARDYQLYFTKQELHENWRMLMNNARTM